MVAVGVIICIWGHCGARSLADEAFGDGKARRAVMVWIVVVELVDEGVDEDGLFVDCEN